MSAICLPPSIENVARAASDLGEGGLAILPTDTVYGVCADIRRADTVASIYVAKGKAFGAPLQLLFAGREQLEDFAELSKSASLLVEALGFGGWTIITPARPGWDSPALAGGRTVGFRLPDAPLLRQVIEAVGAPLAASSANRHGAPSPLTCAEAVSQVGEFCAVALDGGPTIAGIDSTVIDCSDDAVRILREGAIDRLTIARILGVRDIPVLRSVRT